MAGIKSWPVDERPRDILLEKGAEHLTDAQLLAIFLNFGIKGKSAVDIGRDLMQTFGGLRGIYAATDEEIKQIKGISWAKLATLRAMIEVNRRFLREKTADAPVLSHPEQVYELIQLTAGKKDREEFFVLVLDKFSRLKKMIALSKGTVNKNHIYTRELIRELINNGATKAVLAHNHPSGDPNPSDKDIEITKKILRALKEIDPPVKLVDHVIIGDDRWFSFNCAKLLDGDGK